MGNAISVRDFVPYTLEDLGVIIPHSSRFENRWNWFWPQYKVATPECVLKNTIVVFHQRDKELVPIPENVTRVDRWAHLMVLEKEGQSIVWPFQLGLSDIKTRIVARVGDDIEMLSLGWAQKVIDAYNEEPHLKILASVALPGPAFEQIDYICYAPWVKKLLCDGDYDSMEYIHGGVIIANLALWRAYYPEVAEFTRHDAEDIFFTLFSRADGVEVVPFGQHFRHRGPTNQDRIVE